jgi:hypothetical protein
MDWKRGTPLALDQTANPVALVGYLGQPGMPGSPLPHFPADWTRRFWGDEKTSRRFKTWGHPPGDKLGPHFICTRGGIGFHTDVGFARYSVHLELHNEGWWCHGVDENPAGKPMYVPGLVTVLDTHSPHTVTKDPRLPFTGPTKVAAAIDFEDYPPDLDAALDALIAHLPSFAMP